MVLLMLDNAHPLPSIQQTGAGPQQHASYTLVTEHTCSAQEHLWQCLMTVLSAMSHL